jgi:hypothetical protein
MADDKPITPPDKAGEKQMNKSDTVTVNRQHFEFLCNMAKLVICATPRTPAHEWAATVEGLRDALRGLAAIGTPTKARKAGGQ